MFTFNRYILENKLRFEHQFYRPVNLKGISTVICCNYNFQHIQIIICNFVKIKLKRNVCLEKKITDKHEMTPFFVTKKNGNNSIIILTLKIYQSNI